MGFNGEQSLWGIQSKPSYMKSSRRLIAIDNDICLCYVDFIHRITVKENKHQKNLIKYDLEYQDVFR